MLARIDELLLLILTPIFRVEESDKNKKGCKSEELRRLEEPAQAKGRSPRKPRDLKALEELQNELQWLNILLDSLNKQLRDLDRQLQDLKRSR